ncbi:MAG: hypothetical protein ACLQPH_13680 [Acidimicrobiales bacterium]
MTSPELSQLGAQLDEDHAPETNGRMSVCRRCGARTESPRGLHHLPSQPQRDRSSDWLVAQSRLNQINRTRALRGT